MIKQLRPLALASALTLLPAEAAVPLHAADSRLSPRRVDLVLVPGGRVTVGDDAAPPSERPAFRYTARDQLFDRTPVTVGQFRRYVAETGRVTDAERLGGLVLDQRAGAWIHLADATWRTPSGERAGQPPDNHPVTQVSWRDADLFCRSYGMRLPTEFEWERAARLGQTPDGHVFKAGDPLRVSGRYRANVWQGLFPLLDHGEDGYRGTSPVGAFGVAPSGLSDMAGNVWQWTSSSYRPYQATGSAAQPSRERVHRGGSFLCDPTFCEGFRATARGHATPDSALVNVGFRCVIEPGLARPIAGRIVIGKTST